MRSWLLLPLLLVAACGVRPNSSSGDDDDAADDDDATEPYDASLLPQGNNPSRPPMRVWISFVIDGDTAEVITEDGFAERVRFLSVDTPEINANEPWPADCWAYEARTFTRELLPEDQPLWLTFDGEERDDFDRLLAYLFIGSRPEADFEQSVNYQLIRGGWASTFFFPNNQTFREELEYAEFLAQEDGVGVWDCD